MAMTRTLGPREVSDRMRQGWLGDTGSFDGDLLAEDVLIEAPFAPPARPGRIEGRAAVRRPRSSVCCGRGREGGASTRTPWPSPKRSASCRPRQQPSGNPNAFSDPVSQLST